MDKKIILIKYGELTLKKNNSKLFRNHLLSNIKTRFKDCHIEMNRDRMYIHYDVENEVSILDILDATFGLVAYSICEIVDKDLDAIKENAFKQMDGLDKSFKVFVKRVDKKFPTSSLEIARDVGGYINQATNNWVDVKEPEVKLNIEIRDKYAYVYTSEVRGLGGLPVGSSGKGLLLLSGGIDSPVAGYMMNKRGVKFHAIHFESSPYTSVQALDKVRTLSKKLAKYNGDFRLFVVNFTSIQEALLTAVPSSYYMVTMRRFMYRIAQQIAIDNDFKVVINGDAIGQVASQTLTSMATVDELMRIPLIRPLAVFDKVDIKEIAYKIDTYETSILPFEDCCTIFVPKNPQINPSVEKAIAFEKEMDIDLLVANAIDSIKVEYISFKNNEFEELL